MGIKVACKTDQTFENPLGNRGNKSGRLGKSEIYKENVLKTLIENT